MSAQQIPNSPDDKTENSEKPNHKILLVDDDESIRHTLIADLNRIGFTNIIEAEDGQEAWTFLKKERFSMVLTDWKMPVLSGLALINRIRQSKRTRNLPILILSGYLSRDDFRLLEEYPLINKLEKPFNRRSLADKISNLVKESKWLKAQSDTLSSLFVGLDSDSQKTMGAFAELLKKSPRPLPIALEGARILQKNGHHKEAEKIIRIMLSADPKCLIAMNELGKIYLRQQKYAEAAIILEQAQKLCPQNVERLCLIGKAKLNLKENDQARQSFTTALAIDPTSPKAKGGLKIVQNMYQFIENAKPSDIGRSFASILNSIGISKVKDGKIAEGLEHYKSAIQNVDNNEDKAKLSFNLGLGLVRFDRPTEALPWFERSLKLSNGNYEKASRNIANVKAKLEKSDASKVNLADHETEADPIDSNPAVPSTSQQDVHIDSSDKPTASSNFMGLTPSDLYNPNDPNNKPAVQIPAKMPDGSNKIQSETDHGSSFDEGHEDDSEMDEFDDDFEED